MQLLHAIVRSALALGLAAAVACDQAGPAADSGPDDSSASDADAVDGDAGRPDGDAGDAAPGDADAPDTSTTCSDEDIAAFEASMAATLDAAAVDTEITRDPDFTVLLETEDGRAFEHTHGEFSGTTPYESASTSKWVTAVVILDLVDQGLLTTETRASELLPFWTETSVTLAHLLAFTSGFSDEPFCINNPRAVFAECVQTIFESNVDAAAPAGTEFDYSGTHMQVAGLMAVTAAGAADWTEVFDAFKARTGLFAESVYDLPSETNPRLAGGMTVTGEEYLAFLRAVYRGDVLEPATRTALLANHRGDATVVGSPVLTAVGEDWAYGFGNWLECPTATEPNSYDCGEGHRNSSPGAYGAYPFVDFDHRYFGIVARQGALASGRDGVRLFRTIEDVAGQWATRACGD
jgi:CubicO group peptidase (beta-lactamase class C family)